MKISRKSPTTQVWDPDTRKFTAIPRSEVCGSDIRAIGVYDISGKSYRKLIRISEIIGNLSILKNLILRLLTKTLLLENASNLSSYGKTHGMAKAMGIGGIQWG